MQAKKKRRVEWREPMVASSVAAHPELLTIPTFVLFVQKDELAMSRADAHKEERQQSRAEFEDWLLHQTAPRAPAPKKQMQNEESLAPVDDKERSAVAVRSAANIKGGAAGQAKISRPSSDGFRPQGARRPAQPSMPARAYNSQRGARPLSVEQPSPPRSRAITMADTLADPANRMPAEAATGSRDVPPGRSPTRKTPTPRGTPRTGGPPRGKSPTPRQGKSPRLQATQGPPRQSTPPPGSAQRGNGGPRTQTPPRRPPSARKPASNRGGPVRQPSPGVGSGRRIAPQRAYPTAA